MEILDDELVLYLILSFVEGGSCSRNLIFSFFHGFGGDPYPICNRLGSFALVLSFFSDGVRVVAIFPGFRTQRFLLKDPPPSLQGCGDVLDGYGCIIGACHRVLGARPILRGNDIDMTPTYAVLQMYCLWWFLATKWGGALS